MDQQTPFYYNLTIKLLLLLLIVTLLVIGKPLLLPLCVALLFSFMLYPISRKLEQWRVPRSIAILISIGFAVIVVSGLIYFFYTQVMLFVDDWPVLSQQISTRIDSLYHFIHVHFNYSKFEQKNWINERFVKAGESAVKYALSIFSATGSFLASVALLPIFIFFLTYYRDKFKTFIGFVVKNGKADHVIEVIRKVSNVSQKYLKGLIIDIVILSVLNSAGLLMLCLKHAILFGVLAALLNIIPYIGVLIGSVLPIIMALITKDQFSYVIGVAGVCFVVQLLDNNIITPNVVGSSVSINPFTAIIALTIAAMVWGIVGMIIALPFVGMIKVVFDNVESLKSYGYLIGEEAVLKKYNPLGDLILIRKLITPKRKKSIKPENKPES